MITQFNTNCFITGQIPNAYFWIMTTLKLFLYIYQINNEFYWFTSPVAKYRPSGESDNDVIAFRAVFIIKSCFCVWISYRTTVELWIYIFNYFLFTKIIKWKIIPSSISYCWTILTNNWIWYGSKSKDMFKINLKLKEKRKSYYLDDIRDIILEIYLMIHQIVELYVLVQNRMSY
jgi:hypothetical protein